MKYLLVGVVAVMAVVAVASLAFGREDKYVCGRKSDGTKLHAVYCGALQR